MKTVKRQDLNLNQFIERKNSSFLNERDGDDAVSLCRKELSRLGKGDLSTTTTVNFCFSENGVNNSNNNQDYLPGSILALYDFIKKSYQIKEEHISGFKCKIFMPGSSGLIEPSTLMTHSRYLFVLGATKKGCSYSKNEDQTDDAENNTGNDDDNVEDGVKQKTIAEAALWSVLKAGADFEETTPQRASDKRSQKVNDFKPKEVFTFSLAGMSKSMMVEQGQIIGIDGMFSNAVSISFNNEKTFKMPPISNGYRETFVQKKPARRMVIVLDLEQTPSGLAKSVEKMKNMMQKKKILGF